MQRILTQGVLLLILLSSLTFQGRSVQGQEFGPPPEMMMGDPMMGGMGAKTASVPADSTKSAADIRPLLYPDLVSITRFDTRRFNFEGLKNQAAEFIHYAIGDVVDDDDYLVALRKQQKEELTTQFENYLDRVANDFDKLNSIGVGEFYRLNFEEGSDFCRCYAYPLNGASPQTIISLTSRDNPITCFERFGFLIVVLDHSGKVDTSATKEKEKKGDDDEEEVEKVDPLKERRKLTIPSIRARFNKAAPKNNAAVINNIMEGLVNTDGAAISMVFPTAEKFQAAIDYCKGEGLDFPDAELKKINETNAKLYKWASFNVSLTDSPKVVLYASFTNAKGASDLSAAISQSIDGMKNDLNKLIEDKIKELELKFPANPFAPMLNMFFEQLKPVTNESELLVAFDFAPIIENAKIFVPIFGGVPSKEMKKKKPKKPTQTGMPGMPGMQTEEEEEPEFDFGDEKSMKKEETKKETKPAVAPPKEEMKQESKPAPKKEEKKDDEDPFARINRAFPFV